jgi:hypothetical protein
MSPPKATIDKNDGTTGADKRGESRLCERPPAVRVKDERPACRTIAVELAALAPAPTLVAAFAG